VIKASLTNTEMRDQLNELGAVVSSLHDSLDAQDHATVASKLEFLALLAAQVASYTKRASHG
jgi:hypothetical protein